MNKTNKYKKSLSVPSLSEERDSTERERERNAQPIPPVIEPRPFYCEVRAVTDCAMLSLAKGTAYLYWDILFGLDYFLLTFPS